MILELITPPAIEPITLAEAKAHARVDSSDDDVYLTALITAAREMIERMTGRALISQTGRLTLDDWPRGGGTEEWWDGVRDGALAALTAEFVDLPKAPFLAVTSVVTKDESDTPTTWAAANYYPTRAPNGYGRVNPKRGVVWPIVTPYRARGGIEITFTAGYGAAAVDVPVALRQAVKMVVLHWYEKREPASDCAASDLMPMGLGTILASYRVFR
jgi:Phage gp6-like head-tail connector protein